MLLSKRRCFRHHYHYYLNDDHGSIVDLATASSYDAAVMLWLVRDRHWAVGGTMVVAGVDDVSS